MNGIDISGHQSGINLQAVPFDFVIIKATQGKSFVNKDFNRTTTEALTMGKCVGVYHYINGAGVDAEVTHFLKTIDKYLGSVILAVDWEEQDNAVWRKHAYCVQVAQEIKKRTGITPFLYMSKSVCREYNWAEVSSYPLWCAQYPKPDKAGGYQANPWTDKKGWGAWAAPAIMQYTSVGRLPGYGGKLDLNLTVITPGVWTALCKPGAILQEEKNPAPYPVPTKTVKFGSKGNGVRWVQFMLNRAGYGLVVDGAAGLRTEAAIVHYQWKNGLLVDGIVGAATRAALKKAG